MSLTSPLCRTSTQAVSRPLALMLALALLLSLPACGGGDKQRKKDASASHPLFISRLADLDAPVPVVWETLTTPLGLRTFFGPVARVELEPGGAYDIHGSDGSHPGTNHSVVEAVENKRLVLKWGFPRDLPIHGEHTTATLTLVELPGERTRLALKLTGFRTGNFWEDGFYYVEDTWDQAIARLKRRFIEGPIDWSKR